MNAYLPEHTGPDAQAYDPPAIYDWQPAQSADSLHPPHVAPSTLGASPSAPYHHLPVAQESNARMGYSPHLEHDYAMARGSPFSPADYGSLAPAQRQNFQMAPQGVDYGTGYRSTSPHSASPSGGSSPWSTASFPTQEVMYHPDVEISKFNRGSRGSMNSLPLASMRTSHPLSTNGHAYTPKIGMRPHAMSLSSTRSTEEQPWNLIPYTMPFAQDSTGAPGAVPGMGGASFFLRSPTPTKRQRTNQACDKCRERKAKCNGARPSCQRCAARGHICEYAKERRMRGPNKTGRRGSQAELDDPIDLGNSPSTTSPESELSETTARNDDQSPSSSRPGSRRSSSELGQDAPTSRRKASRARSGSGSPASEVAGLPSPPMTAREHALPSGRPSAPIALPTLSNGNLSLQYPMGSSAGLHSMEHEPRGMPGESVIRYAQSMPQIGHHYGQGLDGFIREEDHTGPWQGALGPRGVPGMNVHLRVDSADEHPLSSPADYPQTIHYSVSDVSSSSTPITPEQFEYTWPPAATNDVNSPQHNTFQFGHAEKPQTMLPTLPEFDGESNSLAAWTTETHAEDQPMTMSEDGQRNTLAL